MNKKMSPEKSAINMEIEGIGDAYFSQEKDNGRKRGKAFQYLCLSIICRLDLDDIEGEDIIDGGDEEGIDIIYIEETDNNSVVSIFNCDSSLVNNYSGNEMTKISSGLNYIFESNKDQIEKISNIKLKKKIFDIKGDKEKVNAVNIFYCVFNGQQYIPDNVRRKKEEIEKRYQKFFKYQYPQANLNIEFINSQMLFRIRTKNSETLRNIEIRIPYFDKDKKIRPEVMTGEIEGYLTTFKSKNIATLVRDYGDALFEKNIRGWLRYNKKNKEIYDSCASKESNIFWFLNNGITMIGDKIFADDDRAEWKIRNLQIVNGQQTARMIYEAYKNKNLKKDAKVMCRIYKLKNAEIINKITKATNSQSSIGSRDLMSNDPKQIAIGKCFEKWGYFYERQRKQTRPSKKFKRRITSKKLAQVSLAILCRRPSLARKNIEDNFFNTSKHYYEIFDRDPQEHLLAYLLFEYCDDLKNSRDELRYFGVLHIARIIWEIQKKRLTRDIKNRIKDFENNKINLGTQYKKAVKILKRIIKKEENKIENLGHYLSRVEVDDLLFRKLSKK